MTIFEPTRGNSCLINIFVALRGYSSTCVVDSHISDRLGQLISLRLKELNNPSTKQLTNRSSSKSVTKINNDSMSIFKQYLNNEKWKELL